MVGIVHYVKADTSQIKSLIRCQLRWWLLPEVNKLMAITYNAIEAAIRVIVFVYNAQGACFL